MKKYFFFNYNSPSDLLNSYVPKLSVIISVYNKVRELELLLTALSVQSFKDFEVIIADDGSGEDMTQFISEYLRITQMNIKHVYQEDKGFRKNKILNESIKTSSSGYLVFIDGDCIPHKDFVNAHFQNIKENTVLCGKRVNLSEKLSNEISIETILTGKLSSQTVRHFYDSFKSKKLRSTFVEEGIRIKSGFFRRVFLERNPHIVGCNFSIHKELMEKINGFDENYVGAGIGEDSDIEYRLRLINTKFVSLRYLAILYHLFHKSTKEEDRNYKYFEEVKRKKQHFCRNGIVKDVQTP
jgi:glycosyltransferase involved in cell wall biosynthesis